MKNILFFISFSLFLGTGFLLGQNSNTAEFKFTTETINYGKIDRNSNGVRVFEFTNIGKAPLIIKTIQSACGCTVPKKPTKPIMPGEKGKIEVEYDTSRLGGFSKIITIFSNAKIARKTLKIRGYVNKKKSMVAVENSMLINQ